MAVPTDMDGFSEKIGTADAHSRLALGDALLNYLGNNVNSIECNDIGQFIDKLVPWLTCSNFKVTFEIHFFDFSQSYLHRQQLKITNSHNNYSISGCSKRLGNNDCFGGKDEKRF